MSALPENLGTRFGDLSDLPPELLEQIPAARLDAVEAAILDLLKGPLEGAASVDEILVGLFRVTGVIYDRRKIVGKLYRMVSAKPALLESVEKRRGVYRLPP